MQDQIRSKTKYTMLNAIFSALSLLVSSVLNLIATRVILVYLGSDYNGLHNTVTQFLTVLMLIESGFTVAALIKLYKPYNEQNFNEINGILSKTHSILTKIGLIMFVAGSAVSAIYALFIKTKLDYVTVLLIFIFSILSTAFNFAYTYKFRLLFQASQTEYIIQIVNIIMNCCLYIGMILLIIFTHDIVIARFYFMACNILFGFVIGFIAKKKFPFAKFNADCKDVKIEGTKELLISKIVGVLYDFLTVFFLSISSGLVITSVYTIYNSIITLISNFVNVFFTSPRNSLGLVIHSEKDKLKKILSEYEYVVILVAGVLFSTTLALIIPFIRLYTSDINDVNYIVPAIAFLIAFTSIFQLIHIPSGQCIELGGLFKILKRFQLSAMISLLVLSGIGMYFGNLYGLMIAKLFTSFLLAVLEIWYTHTKMVKNSLGNFLKTLIPNFLFMGIITTIEYIVLKDASINIVQFVLLGFATVCANGILVALFNLIFYRKRMLEIIMRFTSVFNRFNIKKV